VSPSKQSIPAKAIPPTIQSQALIQLRQVYKVYETAAGDFLALPGVSMNGVVESVGAAPNAQAGDGLYSVHIRLSDPDPRLLGGRRWK
jgi:hypothetical protein